MPHYRPKSKAEVRPARSKGWADEPIELRMAMKHCMFKMDHHSMEVSFCH